MTDEEVAARVATKLTWPFQPGQKLWWIGNGQCRPCVVKNFPICMEPNYIGWINLKMEDSGTDGISKPELLIFREV